MNMKNEKLENEKNMKGRADLQDTSGAVGADAEVLQIVNASLSPEGGAGSEVRGGVGHCK